MLLALSPSLSFQRMMFETATPPFESAGYIFYESSYDI